MSEKILNAGWMLCCTDAGESRSWEELNASFSDEDRTWTLPVFPMQVHDVLLDAGMIENPNIRGINKDLWIHEKDWIYRCDFSARHGIKTLLCLDGTDTFADVWLNGRLVGRTEDAYLAVQFDVTEEIRTENRLVVHFHSAQKRVEQISSDSKYEGLVPPYSMLRVFRTGFHDYCGPSPCLIRCGLYAPVRLLQADPAVLADATVRVHYDPESRKGTAEVLMTWMGEIQGLSGILRLKGPDGRIAGEKLFFLNETAVQLETEKPELWYPRTYGKPETFLLTLEAAGIRREWITGFRDLKVNSSLQFAVNGLPIRPWGANLMHLDTLSNCWQPDRMKRLLDLAELADCNMLRIWGEADRLPQEFYDECDRRGILLWQDFFLGCSLYPEEEDYRKACAEEAEQLILSLRHHPSIAIWCGGNELYLARDYQHPEAPCYGETIVKETLRGVCEKLDPGRYYHISSPSGGRWANDPSDGDTHGYTHLWFVPGRLWPMFLSENCRVSAPVMSSMRKMMTPEELWPEGYHAGITRSHPYEWPETWNRHTPNEGWRKLGPVEHYLDAETPEEMLYRINMAHAEYIHTQVGRFRRGSMTPGMNLRTGGHLLWRLNDNSNVISFGVVDYFLNPGHAFYEMKRCYQPLYVCCEPADSARIWFVNDTPHAFRGQLEVFLFHLIQNCVTARLELPFEAPAGTSSVLCDLDEWGQFRKENIVCMRVRNPKGELVCEAFQPMDIERRLPYPELSGLKLQAVPGGVLLECERYAHCVELWTDDDGMIPKWVFSDNYFDMVPGTKKFVKVTGTDSGQVFARAAYDGVSVVCVYRCSGKENVQNELY